MIGHPLGIVIPSKTEPYLSRLFRSFHASDPEWTKRCHVYVVDNGIGERPLEWQVWKDGLSFIKYRGPFNFAKAVNQGIYAWLSDIATEKDRQPWEQGCMVLNDDTVIQSAGFFERILDYILDKRFDNLGVFSPSIEGGVGNLDQAVRLTPPHRVLLTTRPICFVSAVIRHEVLRKIGLLDERFVGYGWEDTDYSIRVHRAGYRLGIIEGAHVKHGSEEGIMHGTFGRGKTAQEMRDLFLLGRKIFVAKWGEEAVTGPLGGLEILK